MDFSYDKHEVELAKAFDKVCREKIAPRAKAVDEAGELSRENWADLVEVGFFALPFPEDIGGLGAPWAARAMAEESLARACASTFLSAGASIGLCGGPIYYFGSDAQKERWLKPMIAGETIGCFGLTEPGVGSDVARMKARAKKTDSGWTLSGEKALITNAPLADVAVVMAVTDPDAGYGGVTAFVVDLGKDGVTRTDPYRKMGLRGSPTGGLVFDEVALSDDDVVGEVGQGFMQAMMTLEHGRIGMAHFGIGIAEAAYEQSMKYAGERESFGKPIARHQAVHFKIADMKVELDAARLMAREVAWLKYEKDQPCRDLASIAKLYATEMAVRVTDHAVQIHGGWGYTDDFEVERLYRDARLGPIGEGTSEIQRELIARSILGEMH
jgi:alkylation response protein AidB-like acyl-CoA dehydrogenase